jgi:hypothetical protein
MTRVIVHVAKIAVAVITALLMSSCGFESNFKKIDGNGNVVTKTRPASQDFNAVSVSGGLEVIVEQGSRRTITVEADENLHEHIKTEVKDGVLEVSVEGNIRNAKASRVIVQLPEIAGLESSGGAVLSTKGSLKADTIEMETGGGGNMDVTVNAKVVKCDSGSGSHLSLHGTAERLEAEASSGSHLNAKDLMVKTAVAEASSGGHAYINVSEDLTAEASSGGQIVYKETPGNINKKTSSGGNVSQE